MVSDYYIDLEQISLERFKRTLGSKELLPGRMILKEHIEKRFGILESMGISNLQELWDALKTKKQVAQFADKSGLSEDYLVILRREVSSYIPKPINLKALPNIDAEYIERLANADIKHTKHLFDRARTKRERAELSEQLNIPGKVLLELVKLSDLVRILGVGPSFARLLYEAGVDSVATFVHQSPEELIKKIHTANEEKQYTKVNLTTKDIIYCLETASLLPQVIEYE